ncbi:hypothetical protein HNR40_002004 [Nonomuraea endophytica]|uniref:Uncharacterized protein n=2 Tax=Nonomuraea endophytica TaxID=714136 RepID=A0A7W8EDG7_9ACTN|nr:hypothetical protein [Nonomuraea endophytica]
MSDRYGVAIEQAGDLLRWRSPLRAELWASRFVAEFDADGGDEEAFGELLEGASGQEAALVAAALSAVGTPVRAADPGPEWLARLGDVTCESAWYGKADPYGEQVLAALTFRYRNGKEPHTVVVAIDQVNGGIAVDVAVEEPKFLDDLCLSPADPALVAGRILEAFSLLDMLLGAPVADTLPPLRALTLTRARSIPAHLANTRTQPAKDPGHPAVAQTRPTDHPAQPADAQTRPTQDPGQPVHTQTRPTGDPAHPDVPAQAPHIPPAEARSAPTDDPAGSDHAQSRPADEVAQTGGTTAGFRAPDLSEFSELADVPGAAEAYRVLVEFVGDRDLWWSPARVSAFLTVWLPREATLSREAIEAMPEVVRAWTRRVADEPAIHEQIDADAPGLAARMADESLAGLRKTLTQRRQPEE